MEDRTVFEDRPVFKLLEQQADRYHRVTDAVADVAVVDPVDPNRVRNWKMSGKTAFIK